MNRSLDALMGLTGLIEMIVHRSDISDHIREVLLNNHRMEEALAVISASTKPIESYKAKNAAHGWTGRGFGFDGGSLYLDKDGNGTLCFEEESLGWEDDLVEGGKPYRTTKLIAASEMVKIRDYLNKRFPVSHHAPNSPEIPDSSISSPPATGEVRETAWRIE